MCKQHKKIEGLRLTTLNRFEPNRNRMIPGDNVSRFQVLAQIPQETFNRLLPEPNVLPNTSRQFQATTSNVNPNWIPFKAKPSKSADDSKGKKMLLLYRTHPRSPHQPMLSKLLFSSMFHLLAIRMTSIV